MSQAIIRGMQDEQNQQFVAYFLPVGSVFHSVFKNNIFKTQETIEKRAKDKSLGLDFDDDAVYDYKLTKEYNWNVKNKGTQQ